MSTERVLWPTAALAALLLAASGCSCGELARPAPVLERVTPAVISEGRTWTVTLEGQNFYADLKEALGTNDPPVIDDRFGVAVGDLWVDPSAVRFVDTHTLQVDVPPLAIGAYPVTVTTPAGESSTLEGALQVVSSAELPVPVSLAFANPPVQLPAGQCSPAVEVTLVDAAGAEVGAPTATTVSLSADAQLVAVFADSACERPATEFVVPPGGSRVQLFILGRIPGETTLSASAPELTSATQAAAFLPALSCAHPAVRDGAACDDGRACSTGDACQGGTCVAVSSACGLSLPPLPCFTAQPLAVGPGQSVTFDPSCTDDDDYENSQLVARYDFEGDGVWDTDFAPLGQVSHAYPNLGRYEATMEVRDPESAVASTARMVVVASNVIQVTTAADEADSGATLTQPKGTGLSLREALTLVNSSGAAATITFSGPFQFVYTRALPELTPPGSALVGFPGATLNFAGAGGTSACITLAGAGQVLAGFDVTGCNGHIVATAEADIQVTDSRFHGPSIPMKIGGIRSRIGPRNSFDGFLEAETVQVKAYDALIDHNLFFANGDAVVSVQSASGGLPQIIGNVFRDNSGMAIEITGGEDGPRIWFNVFHRNGGPGVFSYGVATPIDLRNNVFTYNGSYGLQVPEADVSFASPNAFFGNTPGDALGLSPRADWVTAAPGYANESARDLRPGLGSPLIDKGVDVGVDVNGSFGGLYSGPAPDLGAYEMP